jgi:hypothetical protein
MKNDGATIGCSRGQAASPARKRRANRTARCRAYHCRFTRFIECLRLRVPSGMAIPFGWRQAFSVLLFLPAKSEPICYGKSALGSCARQLSPFCQRHVPPIRKVLTAFPLFRVRPTSAEGTNSISAGKTPMGAGKTGIADLPVRLAHGMPGLTVCQDLTIRKELWNCPNWSDGRTRGIGRDLRRFHIAIQGGRTTVAATRRLPLHGGRRTFQPPVFLPVASALRTPAI